MCITTHSPRSELIIFSTDTEALLWRYKPLILFTSLYPIKPICSFFLVNTPIVSG